MAGYTTGQAGVQAQQVANTPTAYAGDVQELARSQRLAQLLSGQQMPEGEMVSGRYVKPSWTQQLAGLVNAGTGAYFADQAEKQNLALAKKIREGENVAIADYMAQLQGKPATQQQTEVAGPYTGNVPMPTATRDIPAVPANPQAANLNAAQNDMLPSWLRTHAMKEATKGPEWKEISQYNDKTGNTETYRYNANATDPRSTMQFLGVSKPAMSRAEALRLGDEGIGTGMPSAGGGGVPSANGVGNMPPAGGAPAGGNAPLAGGGQAPAVKPASQANQSDLVKAYGYDPFKEPTPPNLPNKDIRQWRADLYKPLSGTAGDQVTGAKLYYDTLTKYNNYVDGLTAADLAKPSVRQMLTSLHAQVKLTGKEANKLGVLNGGDERILDEVIPNYKDILVTKENLKKMIQNQQEFGSNIIVNAYGTQQKPVPETMRKYVAVPKAEAPPATDIKTVLKTQNIPYDPSYEYKVNPDGSVARRKKQ